MARFRPSGGPPSKSGSRRPLLQELLERQRRSLAATRAPASESVPPALRASVEAEVTGSPRDRFRWMPRLAFGGVAAAVATVGLVLVLAGGPAAPTVADAAELAALPQRAGTGSPRGEPNAAGGDVEGVRFPDFRRPHGWRADGVRAGSVDGREATVVYYRKRRAADRLCDRVRRRSAPPSGAEEAVRRGVEYRALRAEGQLAVTWRRAGHTCVLIGEASRQAALLASWRGGGASA